MWGIGRYNHLAHLVEKARDIGFTHIEINYQVTEEMLGQLKTAPGLAVSSVHSPCPGYALADGRWTYRLRMTSEDEDEHRPALEGALRTIDTAVTMGAPIVVLHVGSVPLEDGLEPKLRDMYKNGKRETDEFLELRDRLLADRCARKGPYIDRAMSNLRRLVARASDCGVKIGLESRYYFHEMPDLQEMKLFLDEFGDAVGYWHDVGHSENLARLGFTPHMAWLEALSSRIIGTHIHDIDVLRDHHAPGKGTLDLAGVSPYLPAGAARVCELASSNTEEELSAGLRLLKDVGII